MEVALPVAAAASGGVIAAVIVFRRLFIDGPEALDRRPRLDLCPVHREVLLRQKTLHRGQGDQMRQKARRHIARQKTLPVLREHRRIPHAVVDPQPHKPLEQKVELKLLHKLALRADRVERLKQKRPQQFLRRDPGTARARIKRLELSRHLRQRRVRQIADRPQRMTPRHPRLQIHIAEKAAAALVLAPHRCPHRIAGQRITSCTDAPGVFQQPARSASNSAKVARMLKNILPMGSPGS